MPSVWASVTHCQSIAKGVPQNSLLKQEYCLCAFCGCGKGFGEVCLLLVTVFIDVCLESEFLEGRLD